MKIVLLRKCTVCSRTSRVRTEVIEVENGESFIERGEFNSSVSFFEDFLKHTIVVILYFLLMTIRMDPKDLLRIRK